MERAGRGLRVVRLADGADDRAEPRARRGHRGGVGQLDPADRDDRQLHPAHHLGERGEAHRRVGALLRASVEDGPETEQRGPGARALERLGERVRREADREPRREAARQRRGQVVLAEVDAVGVREEREIDPIVHDEGDACGVRERAELAGEGEARGVGQALGAELQDGAATGERRARDLRRVATARVLRIDEHVEAAGGGGIHRGVGIGRRTDGVNRGARRACRERRGRYARAPMDADAQLARRARGALLALAAAAGVGLLALSWQRYATYHNRTFDLAFYTRIAWGLVRYDPRESIVGAHVAGLHLSVVLLPLGVLGRAFGTVPVLLAAQAAAYAATAFPLARLAGRRLGPPAYLAAGLAWLLQPNLGHVVPYEFHPGTLAVLPLAWLVDALDRGAPRTALACVVATLACREDLATMTAAACAVGAVAFARGAVPPGERRRAVGLALAGVLGSAAYLLYFLLVLHPRYAPPVGSLQLHFGRWGNSFPEVARHLLSHPGDLAEHLVAPRRLLYGVTVLAPVGLVWPLLRPRWLIPALPALAVNLVSHFPTTLDLASHYLTPALPFVLAAAIEGMAHLVARLRARPGASRAVTSRLAPALLGVPALLGHVLAGGTPLSRDFPMSAFRADAFTRDAESVVARIPATRSVQAPDALLPHLAERRSVLRGPPPDRAAEYVVLDVRHRARFRHRESLIRTDEEPLVRDWVAKEKYGVVHATSSLLLLARGADPRGGAAGRYLRGRTDPEGGVALCDCLAVEAATLRGDVLTLDLAARGGCPSDLVLRLGVGWRPRRVDLWMDGVLSPAHLRRGDRAQSVHPLEPGLRALVVARGLRLGVLRQSGARPEPDDPMSAPVQVRVEDAGRAQGR